MQPEALAYLYRALQLLLSTHRVAVILHDREGYNYRAVAAMRDVPEGTAKGGAAWAGALALYLQRR